MSQAKKSTKKVHGAPLRRVAAFTDEQQYYYECLTERQRKYVDYRSAGYLKADSARRAGFSAKNASQNATIMEKQNPKLLALIESRLAFKRQAAEAKGTDLAVADAGAVRDAVAAAVGAVAEVNKAGGEFDAQCKFFRDVAEGKIRTVRKTTYIDKEGTKTFKIEEINDVDVRMRARKELDRLLGLSSVVDMGRVEVGKMVINFVDATMKDGGEQVVEAKGNRLYQDLKAKAQVVDGDEKIILSERVEKGKKVRPANSISIKGQDALEEVAGDVGADDVSAADAFWQVANE